MSASDLAPFVAAVIEDGIVAELQHKIEDLESKIQRYEENQLRVQITGRTGGTTYKKRDHRSALVSGGLLLMFRRIYPACVRLMKNPSRN